MKLKRQANKPYSGESRRREKNNSLSLSLFAKKKLFIYRTLQGIALQGLQTTTTVLGEQAPLPQLSLSHGEKQWPQQHFLYFYWDFFVIITNVDMSRFNNHTHTPKHKTMPEFTDVVIIILCIFSIFLFLLVFFLLSPNSFCLRHRRKVKRKGNVENILMANFLCEKVVIDNFLQIKTIIDNFSMEINCYRQRFYAEKVIIDNLSVQKGHYQ